MRENILRIYIREILKEGKLKPLERNKFVESLDRNLKQFAATDTAIRNLFEKDSEYANALGWKNDYPIENYLKSMLTVYSEKNPEDKSDENAIVRARLNILGDDSMMLPPPGVRLRGMERYDIFAKFIKARGMAKIPEFDAAAASLSPIISELASKRGWFVLRDSFRHEYHEWIIMPNYTEKIEEVPDKLYHVTPEENVNRILKTGLIPKSKGRGTTSETQRTYPGRIYVAGSEAAAKRVIDGFAGGWGKGTKYAIIEIDKKSLSKGTKFFKDNEYTEGEMYWTYSGIPAQAVKLKE